MLARDYVVVAAHLELAARGVIERIPVRDVRDRRSRRSLRVRAPGPRRCAMAMARLRATIGEGAISSVCRRARRSRSNRSPRNARRGAWTWRSQPRHDTGSAPNPSPNARAKRRLARSSPVPARTVLIEQRVEFPDGSRRAGKRAASRYISASSACVEGVAASGCSASRRVSRIAS